MLTKSDLAERVAKRANMPMNKANELVATMLEIVTESLADGEEIRLTGFGTFRVSERAERTARNPRTGQLIKVPAGRRASFSPGTRLTEAVRGEKKKAA